MLLSPNLHSDRKPAKLFYTTIHPVLNILPHCSARGRDLSSRLARRAMLSNVLPGCSSRLASAAFPQSETRVLRVTRLINPFVGPPESLGPFTKHCRHRRFTRLLCPNISSHHGTTYEYQCELSSSLAIHCIAFLGKPGGTNGRL